MKQLNFESVEFCGFEEMEPLVFSPNVEKYTIYRKAGQSLSFCAKLNRAPAPKKEDGDLNYQPYPGFTHQLCVAGVIGKSSWSPGCWNVITVCSGVSEVRISCDRLKAGRPEGEKTFSISLTVHTTPMTEEERLLCTHPSTYTSEGEFWGGCSGTCTVEIFTSCTECGATISRHIESRD